MPVRLVSRLLLVAALALVATGARAQTTVRDSVLMTPKAYYSESQGDTGPDGYGHMYYYFGCEAGVYATWPDVLKDLGRPGSYTLRTADGSEIPGIPASNNPQRNFLIPAGFLGRQVYGTLDLSFPVTLPNAPDKSRCVAGRAAAQAGAASAGPWYATFLVPDGTPVALYTWKQTAGLDVAFDGSFESRQSHEVDASQPSGRRPVVSYAWDFGDGASGSGARPTHTYARADTFRVRLTVTDDDGQTNAHTEKVLSGTAQLTVRVESRDTPVTVGERMRLVATITNTGTQNADYVSVDRAFAHTATFPDSVAANDTRDPVLRRVETVDPDPATRARLAPGESMTVRVQYAVERAGTYRPAGGSDYAQVETRVRSAVLNVRASAIDGTPVRVVDACADGGCPDETVIRPKASVRLEFRTDGAVTSEARTGLEYHAPESPLLYQVLGKSAVSPFSYSGSVDGGTGAVSGLEQHCHSSCADVVVTVTDPATDLPLAGARVTLSAPLVQGEAVVTPDHSGGHFCGGGACDNPLEVETDENGEAHAYYSFPGIIAPQEVEITAEVTAEGLDEKTAKTLRLLPNQRTDFVSTITLTPDDTDFLTAAAVARAGGTYFNSAGELCEGFGKWLLGGASDLAVRPGTSYVLHGAANVLAEWACSLFPPTLLSTATAGNTKKIAETSMVAWFGERFLAPDGGLGTLNGPFPPPFVVYFDGDYYSALLDATAGLARSAPGSTVTLELFEVSWLRAGALAGNPLVPSVYFRLAHEGAPASTAIVEAGYVPERWLSPPPSEALAEIAHATADRIRVQQTLDRIRAGDFVWLDLDTPFAERFEVRFASGSQRPGSAGAYEVLLSRPLRFEHAADARVTILRGDSLASPPSPPIVAALDSVGVDAPLVLRWGMGRLETPASYRIEVARDSLFADRIASAGVVAGATSAAPPQQYLVGDVADGDVVYWRVRGENLIGVGPWSRTGRVEAVRGFGTAAEGSPEAAPTVLALGAPYPNPARAASVTVQVDLPEAGLVRLAVYDALGREVVQALDGEHVAGRHAIVLDTAGLPSGVYVIRLAAGGTSAVRRLTVVR